MRSTSFHTLNADKELPPHQLRLWYLLNRINNHLLPNLHGAHLEVRAFRADTSGELWSQTSPRSAPADKLCDLFWMQFPWERVVAELGSLHVFHARCGAGDLFHWLQGYSGGYVAEYTGYDTEAHFDWTVLMEQCTNVNLYCEQDADAPTLLPESTNFIVSRSALQHVEADLDYFRQVRDFIARTGNEVIQVHFFPSRIGLDLYGREGVRQYSLRSVSRIARLFKDFSYAILYRMGGRACNAVHWRFIVQPLRREEDDLRDTRPQEYDRALRQAVARDSRQPSGEPSYYALVIHSNSQNRIFD